MTAEEDAPAVTDAALLELANAGADWFCAHCAAGNRGDRAHCMKCGASRHTVSRAPHTPNTRPPEPPKYEAPEPPKYESNKSYFVVGGVLVLLIAFGVWAMQSHTVVGVVARMSWSRTTTVQAWTQVTERAWRHDAVERTMVPPVNGQGEKAGYVLQANTCNDEFFKDESYTCGTKEEEYDCSYTETYKDTCTSSEQYKCGTTTKDKGNGFASREDKYCSRPIKKSCEKTRKIPKTCTRTVPRTCTRPVYKSKCTYAKWVWKDARSATTSGAGVAELKWPNVQLSSLEREVREAKYLLEVSYADGAPETFTRELDETGYMKWRPGQEVLVNVTNLGIVSSYSAK